MYIFRSQYFWRCRRGAVGLILISILSLAANSTVWAGQTGFRVSLTLRQAARLEVPNQMLLAAPGVRFQEGQTPNEWKERGGELMFVRPVLSASGTQRRRAEVPAVRADQFWLHWAEGRTSAPSPAPGKDGAVEALEVTLLLE